jgi:hypothetical protein
MKIGPAIFALIWVTWQTIGCALTEEELLSVSAHIEGNDFPEKPSLYRAMAQELGFPQAQQLSQHTWHQSWCFHR